MPNIDRITFDPQVMGGRPCIRNLRVTVGTIVGLFAAGRSEQEILQAYPYLQPEDLRATLTYGVLENTRFRWPQANATSPRYEPLSDALRSFRCSRP